MLANEFTFREIQLRGLTATGRAAAAARLLNERGSAGLSPAPQWAVIERITAGGVLAATGVLDGAEEALLSGLRDAELLRLPHQAQRAVRIATTARLAAAANAGRAAVRRLDALE